MKTKLIFTIVALVFTALMLAAQDSTNVVITVKDGVTPLDFVKQNAWSLVCLAFLVFSEWLGQTGKVKEGSVLALIINWIGKLLRSKAKIYRSEVILNKGTRIDIMKSRKSVDMAAKKNREFHNLPKMIILLAALSLPAISSAQDSPWKGFWKPVDQSMFLYSTEDGTTATQEWLFRPEISLTAMKFVPTKDEKVFEVSPFSSAGMGIGYQHFVESNGKPFNNYGFNLLLLFDGVNPLLETQNAGLSLAGTVNALEYANVGIGYDFRGKTAFFMLGVSITVK